MKRTFLFLTFMLFPLNVFSDTLSLQDAIKRAMERNPEIKSSYEKLREIHSKLFPSFLPPNPRVTYQAMFMENNISLGQPIPFPTKLITKGLMMNDEYRKFFYLYKTKTLEVIRKVKESYYDYFLAYKKIEITREIVEILEKMKEIARRKYETGRGKIWDVLKAEIELEKAKNNLQIFEAQKEKALSELKTLLDSVNLESFTPQEIELKEEIPEKEILKKLLSEKNPLLKAFEYDVKARNKEKLIAIQSLLPDVMPQVLYNIETGDKKFAISFEIPLFYFHEIGKIREKSSKLKVSEFRFKNLELKLNEKLESLFSMYKAKLDRFNLFKNVILPKTEEAFSSAEAGYITGKFDFLTYIETEKMLFDAKIGYFVSLTDVLKIKAKIEELTGGEL